MIPAMTCWWISLITEWLIRLIKPNYLLSWLKMNEWHLQQEWWTSWSNQASWPTWQQFQFLIWPFHKQLQGLTKPSLMLLRYNQRRVHRLDSILDPIPFHSLAFLILENGGFLAEREDRKRKGVFWKKVARQKGSKERKSITKGGSEEKVNPNGGWKERKLITKGGWKESQSQKVDQRTRRGVLASWWHKVYFQLFFFHQLFH